MILLRSSFTAGSEDVTAGVFVEVVEEAVRVNVVVVVVVELIDELDGCCASSLDVLESVGLSAESVGRALVATAASWPYLAK